MAGIVRNPKRPRYQSNQRFDVVDADVQSRASREFVSALSRAMLSTPRATAATAVGTIISGFSLTLNPTGAGDGKVRINTEAAIGLDADGGLLVKPSGTTMDITIPAGQHQVYVYYQETETDNAKRRFIPAVAPYVEFTRAINTALQGTINAYVRAGGIGTAIAEDNVNGVTVPLLLVGIVTNTAGAITCTGYNATTAPNGSDITNRVSAAVAPSTPPTVNTRNGSLQTVQDVLAAALHSIGQTAWKGSDFLTPSASNNYGAYNTPAGGVDKAFRQALGYVTIGNGTTVFGDFNTSDYPTSSKNLLDAAIASLPTPGGRIVIKRGVALSDFDGAVVTLPASKTVEIVGDHSDVPGSGAQLVFIAAENLTAVSTGKLILRNLRIDHAASAVVLGGPVECYDCFFNNTATSDGGAALTGTNVADLVVQDCTFKTAFSVSSTTNAAAVRVTGTGNRIRLNRVTMSITGSKGHGVVLVSDVRRDVLLTNITVTDSNPATYSSGTSIIKISSTDNVTEIRNRRIENVRVAAAAVDNVIEIGNTGHLTVANCEFDSVGVDRTDIYADTTTNVGPILITGCAFRGGSGIYLNSTLETLTVERCTFDGVGAVLFAGSSTNAQGTLIVRDCDISDVDSTGFGGGGVIAFSGNTMDRAIVEGCTFERITVDDVSTAYIVLASSDTLQYAEFSNNRIKQFQNIAYGGASTNIPRIFGIASDFVSSAVVVKDNHATLIRNATSGSAHKAAVFLWLDSFDQSTDTTIIWSRVVVTNNVVGDGSSFCSFMRSTNMYASITQIHDNQHTILWDTTASKPQYSTSLFYQASWPNTATTMRQISIDGNSSHIGNSSNDTIGSAWIFMQPDSNALDVHVINTYQFSNNQISTNQSGQVFTQAVACGQTLHNLTVFGNTAARNTTSGTAWFHTAFTGTVTRGTPSNNPGVGVAWGSNNLIHSQV